MASNEMQQVCEVAWLTEAEQQQLLKQWNDTRQEFGTSQCAQRMIEAQVERTPEQIAVIHDAEQLSYRELNRRANRLAHYLQAQGVGPETLVGLCVERSPEMVVALLAIMKAGGAYVPLDPAYPTPRLQFIIEDAGLRLLITQERVREKLAMHGCTVVCLDSDAERWAELPVANPKSNVEAENLAYVIYTSGSTGSPKGVTISHRNLSSYIRSACHAYSLSTSDLLLQFFSISFDGSVEEIFPTLSCGATLVLRKGQMVNDPAVFLRQCEVVGLTVLDIPTAYSREVAQELERGLVQAPESVRLLIVSLAALPMRYVDRRLGWSI
jgi:non-ribosomal peptide synthetase component F